MISAGLYIHIPFCVRRCGYCTFATFASGDKALWLRYTEALERQILAWSGKIRARSVFFGGGTPSLLPVSMMERIVRNIRENFEVEAGAEWTLEAHPATCLAEPEKLPAYAAMGFNRISFGIESFHAPTLERLGRRYCFENIVRLMDLTRAAGLRNINLDLILGWPWESLEIFQESVRLAAALNPQHLSLYPLSIEEGTPLKTWRVATDPDQQAEQYLWAHDFLEGEGWEHYEIANYARSGFRARHNLIYWNYEDYLGLGLAAASKIGNRHFRATHNLHSFLCLSDQTSSPFVFALREGDQGENFSVDDWNKHRLIMRLRLKEGVAVNEFQTIIPDDTVSQFESLGYLVRSNGQIHLTPQGWLLSNRLFSSILYSGIQI